VAKAGKLVVISGPSGVGKSTVIRRVLARTGATYSVSATTRRPRPGETDGHHYRFVDAPAFDKMVADGEMLEWADVFGQRYGTPAAPVRQALAAGKTVILEIDVQGGQQVHAKMPQATFIFLRPPDDAELARRLGGRGTESPEAMQRRLETARQEIRTADTSGVYTHSVVNDDLDRTVDQVVRIIRQEQQ
jgi:guanylate kinase